MGKRILIGLMIIIGCLCLGGCRPQKQILTEYVYIEKSDSLANLKTRIDSLINLTHKTDSIVVKDSVFIKEKGDTVYVERWHTEFRERSVNDNSLKIEIQTDTVIKIQTVEVDRIVENEVIKEVNKLKWWQDILIAAGICFFIILILWVGDKIR